MRPQASTQQKQTDAAKVQYKRRVNDKLQEKISGLKYETKALLKRMY